VLPVAERPSHLQGEQGEGRQEKAEQAKLKAIAMESKKQE